MPWNNPGEIVVANNGQIYTAPLGTTLPTTTTGALNAAFVGLGLITEDGASLSIGTETSDVPAWQSEDPVRILKTARTINSSFALMQWNEETLPFALGGGTITGSAPNFKYSPPSASDGLDERAVVIDANDGDQNYRIVFPRIVVVDAVEVQFQRGAAATFPVSIRALRPVAGDIFNIYSDGDGFAAGS